MDTGQLTRFLGKVEIQANDCILWTAVLNHNGYGLMWADRKMRSTHRLSYEHFRGPIPEGLELDHLCRNRACCNAWHLEPVTKEENMFRSRKTQCKYGHSLADAYIYKHSNKGVSGQRQCCRTCAITKARKQEAAAKILRRTHRDR